MLDLRNKSSQVIFIFFNSVWNSLSPKKVNAERANFLSYIWTKYQYTQLAMKNKVIKDFSWALGVEKWGTHHIGSIRWSPSLEQVLHYVKMAHECCYMKRSETRLQTQTQTESRLNTNSLQRCQMTSYFIRQIFGPRKTSLIFPINNQKNRVFERWP